MMLRTEFVVVVWCVLLTYTSAYKRQAGAMLCEEAVKQDNELPPVPDKESPKCDEYGDYKPVQCYGAWTGKGHCSCVKPLTGERYADITGVSAYDVVRNGRQMSCRCAVDHEFKTDRAVYCDQETGDYLPVVCIGERCRCAERWGAPMHSFGEFNRGESNCQCARRSSDLGSRPGLSLNCNPYGGFDPVQCTGSMCFCVDQDGSQIGQSVFIGEADKLKC